MELTSVLARGGIDDLGRLDSPVHRLDARAKAVVTLAFVVTVMSFDRLAVSALTPLALYPLALVVTGRIPWRALAGKVLVAAPFALAVGVLNPLLDRRPVLTLGAWTVTSGWLSFASIGLRFALTTTAALALVACTGMPRLAHGLAGLGVPRVFVTQLLFLYRYLFVLADRGARLVRAVALRSPRPGALPPRVYGSLVGHLLLRALERAERVHAAMLARGFDGAIRPLHPHRLRAADVLFAAGWLGFFAAARAWNLALLPGRWLMEIPR